MLGIALNDDERVLVVRTPKGLQLPGGGIDDDETPQAALEREFLEETGWDIEVGDEIGHAVQYTADLLQARKKLCRFFRVDVQQVSSLPSEGDHEPVWMRRSEAARLLKEDAQRWALRDLVQNGDTIS